MGIGWRYFREDGAGQRFKDRRGWLTGQRSGGLSRSVENARLVSFHAWLEGFASLDGVYFEEDVVQHVWRGQFHAWGRVPVEAVPLGVGEEAVGFQF